MKTRMLQIMSVMMVLGLVLSACQPQIVEVEKIVVAEKEVPVETIVEVEVEKVVKEVEVVEVEVEKIVEKIVEVEVEAEAAPSSYAPSGEVVIAVGIEPVSLAAWRAFAETGGAGFRSVVEQLAVRNYDTGGMDPLLATSWERQNDTTIRFKLREGVSFTDGSAFNAEAAAVAINHSFDPDNAFDILDFLGGSMTATAVDEYTLDVSTDEPDPLLLQKMDWVSIGSAKQLAEAPDTYDTVLIGTGPYKLVEWNAGESLVYEGNPDWWGNSSPDGGGTVSFEKATYRFLSEDSVRAATVKAGEAHIGQYITPDDCKDIEANSGTHCDLKASVETMFIRPDTHSPLFSDIRVRKALLHAIDRQLIVDTILGGAATVASQIVNPTAAGYNPDLSPVAYDPGYATFLMEQAAADGVPTDAEIILGARTAVIPQIAEVMVAIQAMVTEVGFNANVKFYDPEAFGKAVVMNWSEVPLDRNLVAVHLHGNEILDWATSYRFYMSCEGILSVYCNEEADALWTEALPLTGDARVALLQQANASVVEDFGVGHVAHMDLAYAVSDDLDWDIKLDHRITLKEMKPAG